MRFCVQFHSNIFHFRWHNNYLIFEMAHKQVFTGDSIRTNATFLTQWLCESMSKIVIFRTAIQIWMVFLSSIKRPQSIGHRVQHIRVIRRQKNVRIKFDLSVINKKRTKKFSHKNWQMFFISIGVPISRNGVLFIELLHIFCGRNDNFLTQILPLKVKYVKDRGNKKKSFWDIVVPVKQSNAKTSFQWTVSVYT